jgi:hypothetical protein
MMIQRDRIPVSLATVIPINSETRVAVTGWLGFAQTAVLDRIDSPNTSRAKSYTTFCIRAPWAAVRLPT